MAYKQNSINEAYWRKYTEEASKFYKEKMFQLGTEDELKGSVHGIDAPNHMMYKIDTLYSKDGHRAYEFLLEYDIFEPNVGIYYGCKGFTLDGYDHDTEIENFNKEWEQLKGLVCTILNNTFPGKNFAMRFKATNNANDNTYWPFWITLQEEEDIHEVGLRALKLIRNVYRKMLEEDIIETKEFPVFKNNPDSTSFTQKAYTQFIEKLYIYKRGRMGRIVDEEATKKNILLFETFMNNAEKKRIIYRDLNYEYAWQVQEYSNSDFIRLFSAFFQYMADHNLIKTRGTTGVANIPWKELSRFILSPKGLPYGESLRTQKEDALCMPDNEVRHWRDLVQHLLTE